MVSAPATDTGATFPTVVDATHVLGERLGHRAIANGIVPDERGLIRFRKFGGFSVERAESAFEQR